MKETRFSMLIQGEDKKTFYAVCPGFLLRLRGIDLVFHQCIQSAITLTLEPDRWCASDPLTGHEMFRGKKGDPKEEFARQVRNIAIPTLEQKRKNFFPDLVQKRRLELKPAPHPSEVKHKLTVANGSATR